MTTIKYPKNLNTYLGPKGYTIYKTDLTPQQQNNLKTNLLIKKYFN